MIVVGEGSLRIGESPFPEVETPTWWGRECTADPEINPFVECSIGMSPGQEGTVLWVKRQTQDFWSYQKQAHLDSQAHLSSWLKQRIVWHRLGQELTSW